MSIFDFYKYPNVYKEHEELLSYIESNIENYDIFLIVSPVAGGKTVLGQCIANWYGSACKTVPTNVLLSQELVDYPDTHFIARKDSYHSQGAYNRSLEWVSDISSPIICVPHSLISHKIKREMLILDEAHKLLELNRDLYSFKILKSQFLYEDSINTREDFLSMLEFELKCPSKMGNNLKAKRYLKLIDAMTAGGQEARADSFMLKRGYEMHRGKRKDMLQVIPLSPPLHKIFRRFKKLVLMSATISMEDIKSLRLSESNKCVILEIPSRIPLEQRPLVKSYVGAFNYSNIPRHLPAIAQRIIDIANFHDDCKGLVHLTYDLIDKLRPYLSGNPRFKFHSKSGMELATWIEDERCDVLLAAGVSEGLNLLGERYGFQIIGKIPWSNLNDPGIKKRMEISPASYTWDGIRQVMQMYGRICRGARDMGITYVIDESYERLYMDAIKFNLVPKWFREIQ